MRKKIVLVFLLFFLTLSGIIAYDKLSIQSLASTIAAPSVIGQDTSGDPVRLKIPILQIDAAVERVGVLLDGQMDVPKKSDNVGWFDLGSVPGSSGSAVMAGHFDGKNGSPAVFAKLDELKVGDKVIVERTTASPLVFIVKGTRVYDPGFADEVFGQSDGSHLNLITCDGTWDGMKKSYSKRLVVFTDLVQGE